MIKKTTLVLTLLAGTTSLANASDDAAYAESLGTAMTQMQCSKCNSVYTSEKEFEGNVYRMSHSCVSKFDLRKMEVQEKEDQMKAGPLFDDKIDLAKYFKQLEASASRYEYVLPCLKFTPIFDLSIRKHISEKLLKDTNAALVLSVPPMPVREFKLNVAPHLDDVIEEVNQDNTGK